LPQHFNENKNGTFTKPLLPFNDKNQEEKKFYVLLCDCDYIVVLIDRNKKFNEIDVLRKFLLTRIKRKNSLANFDDDINVDFDNGNNSISNNGECENKRSSELKNIDNNDDNNNNNKNNWNCIIKNKNNNENDSTDIFYNNLKTNIIENNIIDNNNNNSNKKCFEIIKKMEFEILISKKVLSIEFSKASLARSFFIPFLSSKVVKYKDYVLLKKIV
jgi:hypothetical protein